jgi:hypothetical protein
MLPLVKNWSRPCQLKFFHSSCRLDTQRDFNEYFHEDRGATFKELRKIIYQPLFTHLAEKEQSRLAQQEKVETVAFTPPVMSDELIVHKSDKIHSIEQVLNLLLLKHFEFHESHL